MTSNRQDQEAGDGAIAVQAGGNVVVVNGLSFDQARQLALDVARNVYYELSGQAKEAARERIEEITEKVLDRLKDSPELLQQATDPGFQRALHAVQVEYAATGDAELGDLLVDLLADRASEPGRNMAQIVLNESISVAPKLTSAQLATLTVIFILRYTRGQLNSIEDVALYFDKHVAPLVRHISTKDAAFQHMQFAGVGSITPLIKTPFEDMLFASYRGLFSLGFDEADMRALALRQDEVEYLFARCPNDPSKVQTKGLQKGDLEGYLDERKIDGELRSKILEMFDRNPLPMDKVRELLVGMRPYIGELMQAWDGSSMSAFQLTSVGMAIGHANIKRIAGGIAELAVWVSE